jgi:hypothetical protein
MTRPGGHEGRKQKYENGDRITKEK